MNEDTKNYSSEAFDLALQKLGSSIRVYAGSDDIKVRVRSLDKNLDQTLALLNERLLQPSFTPEDFSRNKKRTLEKVKNNLNQPAYVANVVYHSILMGKNNPLGKPVEGTASTIENIQLTDIENYYRHHFSKNDMEVVTVGNISEKEIKNKLSFLTQLPGQEIKLPVLPKTPEVEKTKVYFVAISGAAQTEFRIGYVTDLKYDALGDYYQSNVMNYALGGAFNSRLNLYLREEKGWTYGARASFYGDRYSCNYSFSSGIKASATDSALSDILRIINEYKQKGTSAEELSFTQSSMTQGEARKYETGFQKADFLDKILRYDLPEHFSRKQNQLLKQMTVADINNLAHKYLPAKDRLVVLLAGDKASLAKKIQDKGFDLVAVDEEGNIIP